MGWGVVEMVLAMTALTLAWQFIRRTGELSLERANVLAARKQLVLDLGSVTSLTPKAAEALTRHKGYRWLMPPGNKSC